MSINNYLFADIAPDPTIAKGIIPTHPVNIQMVSEIVNAKLTLDSSYVTCTFYMHNLGKQSDLEVGFPVMNYYMWANDQVSPIDQNKFEVMINGKAINKKDTYIPDSLKKMLTEKNQYNKYDQHMYDALRNYDNLKRPWYLWKMHFRANEYLTIIVKYVLPNGFTKSNMYFNYLLSTGAGWKGVIQDAKVMVDFGSIPPDQVLKISPDPFHKINHSIVNWHFRNLKPTLKNDILIEYEHEKGAYNEFETKMDSEWPVYIDGKKSKHSLVDTAQIGDGYVEKHPNGKYDEVIFTKGFILQKFKRLSKKSDRAFWRDISSLSPEILNNRCEVRINGVRVSGDLLYEKLNAIDSINTFVGKVHLLKSGKRKVIIKTKNSIPKEDYVHDSPQ
ncbi:MAG TPA: hypothetical protein VFE53_09030 [Mucilaginibacter sp.]|nr:hypothetical protein [Mucilaginibacter sp.]